MGRRPAKDMATRDEELETPSWRQSGMPRATRSVHATEIEKGTRIVTGRLAARSATATGTGKLANRN